VQNNKFSEGSELSEVQNNKFSEGSELREAWNNERETFLKNESFEVLSAT
jgi:hypothetical protein